MKNILLLFLFIPLLVSGQKRIFNTQDLETSLKIHNLERAQLGLSKLEWSKDLQKDAERYAKYLAKKDVFKHSSDNNQGENLYYEYNSESITTKPFSRATTAWLEEKEDYQYAKIGSRKNANKMIGHYTQMIWNKTTKVGLGAYVNKKGKVYVVARYYPAGNMIGSFPY